MGCCASERRAETQNQTAPTNPEDAAIQQKINELFLKYDGDNNGVLDQK